MSIPIALSAPMTASAVVAQAGTTQLPGAASGVKIPTIRGLEGWDISESTGSATAHFRVYDGTSASGIQLGDVSLLAGAKDNPTFDYPPNVTSGAVYVQIVAGSIEGDIYVLE